jgi:hypothetical protein
MERAELVRTLRDRLPGASQAAVFTSEPITIELAWLPPVARELIAAGGLDAFLRARNAKGR